jgi:hypothetical protein
VNIHHQLIEAVRGNEDVIVGHPVSHQHVVDARVALRLGGVAPVLHAKHGNLHEHVHGHGHAIPVSPIRCHALLRLLDRVRMENSLGKKKGKCQCARFSKCKAKRAWAQKGLKFQVCALDHMWMEYDWGKQW